MRFESKHQELCSVLESKLSEPVYKWMRYNISAYLLSQVTEAHNDRMQTSIVNLTNQSLKEYLHEKEF